jgi:hypothetical protein
MIQADQKDQSLQKVKNIWPALAGHIFLKEPDNYYLVTSRLTLGSLFG